MLNAILQTMTKTCEIILCLGHMSQPILDSLILFLLVCLLISNSHHYYIIKISPVGRGRKSMEKSAYCKELRGGEFDSDHCVHSRIVFLMLSTGG